MNSSRIFSVVCAAAFSVALLSTTSLLAQWNTRPLVPVPPVVNAPASGVTGPVTAFQGSQFGGQPGTLPPTVITPPVITAQPGATTIQPGATIVQPGVNVQPGMTVQPGATFVQPGTGAPAPVIMGSQAVPNMPAPPPGGFGGAGYDPYYQPLPGALPGTALGTPVFPGGNNWTTFGSTAGITPRAGAGTQFGEDVGLADNLSWFHGFIPVFQNPGQSIWFIETRAIKYHQNSTTYGYNIEGGYRWFSPATNRVNGFYAGYDYRNFGNGFDPDQIAFGAESLGAVWDFHINGYLLLSSDTQFINFTNLVYTGNNLVGTANFFDAYEGFDAEVGRSLSQPGTGFDLRVYGGGYGFFSNGSQDAWGVRGRIEATWWDRITAGASIQYDDVFDTTVYGFVSVLFGGANRGNVCGCPTVADRLGDPLRKNMHVVINRRADANTVILNPADNMPLQFLHIDSNAAAGGDGTFETPFNTIAAADAANVAANDILLIHAGSLFTDETLNMQFANQRLLGDSATVPHTTNTQFGVVTLPRANALAAKPVLEGSLVAATGSPVIVTETNVEVSGLVLQDSDGHGILVNGNGLTGFNINRNMISGTDFNNGGVGEGIFLNGDATGSVTDNMLFGGNEEGLRVAGNFNGTITGNSFNGFDMNGMRIEGAFQSGTISGNTAIGNTLDGFIFDSVTGGLVDNNFAGANGGDGFEITTAFTGGQFNNNTSNNNTGMGYNINGAAAPATATNNNGAGNGAAGDTFTFP